MKILVPKKRIFTMTVCTDNTSTESMAQETVQGIAFHRFPGSRCLAAGVPAMRIMTTCTRDTPDEVFTSIFAVHGYHREVVITAAKLYIPAPDENLIWMRKFQRHVISGYTFPAVTARTAILTRHATWLQGPRPQEFFTDGIVRQVTLPTDTTLHNGAARMIPRLGCRNTHIVPGP